MYQQLQARPGLVTSRGEVMQAIQDNQKPWTFKCFGTTSILMLSQLIEPRGKYNSKTSGEPRLLILEVNANLSKLQLTAEKLHSIPFDYYSMLTVI